MIDLRALLATAAELWDVSDGAILDRRRGSDRLAQARQAVAYVLRQHDYTLMEIGTLLRRDHTSIITRLARAEQRLAGSPAFAAKLRALLAAAGGAPPREPPPARARARQVAGPLRLALSFWGVSRPRAA